ncbi:hypothetical protein JW879_01370 [candidate division WOR-3 bacterium]|nr:hypothetical protein [candidate division WOR-3 bacterium]
MKKVALLILFLAFVSYAGIVDFSGSANLYGEYDNIEGGDSLIEPSSQVRFTLSPTISIATLPITFDFQLSSLESKYRQALNKYRISIQPEKMLRDKVNVPSFVLSISNVEFGTCYPYFSPYTLSSVPVSGGVVELNPGFIHLEGTMGNLQRSVDWSDTTYTDYAYERNLYAFNVGVGRRETSHFHFIFLHAGDDSSSVSPYFIPAVTDTDSVEVTKPMENYIAGIDLKLSLLDNRFYIESELVGTEVTRDIRMPELDFEEIPSFLTDIFHPRMSSSFDFAFTVNSALNIYETEIFGSFGMVGPGFESFGNPYLRSDLFAYEAGIKKNLFNNSFFLYGSLEKETDNILGLKGSTTAFNAYEFGIGFNFANLPYLDFSYSPYTERNDSLLLERSSKMYSVNTGYDFAFSNISNYISLFFSYQDYTDLDNSNNYSGTAISVSDEINFMIPLSLSLAVDYSETNYPDMSEDILSFDVGAYYTFFERWTNGVGFITSSEGEESSKKGIYCNSSLYLSSFANMNFDIERNFYDDEEETEDYDEWRLIGSISSSW